MGRREDALASSGQAVRLAMADAGAHAELGIALEAVGRTQEALDSLDRAIALDPKLLNVNYNFGLLASRVGRHEVAVRHFDKELALQPLAIEVHSKRAAALVELGRLAEAAQSLSTALLIEPGNGMLLHNRAVVYALMGRHADALHDYDELFARNAATPADLIGRGAMLVALNREAEALDPLRQAAVALPEDPEAHAHLGTALLRLDRHTEAIESFDRALSLRSAMPTVLNDRGIALASLGRLPEALRSFQGSLALDKAAVDVHVNAGIMRKSLGLYDDAFASFGQALALKPRDPTTELELAFLHLTLGEFSKGWRLYESRFAAPTLNIPKPDFAVPRWDGSFPIAGRTLLVHAEQGLGDTIQFCRYLPLLAAQRVTVVFQVMPALKALMQTLGGNIQVVARGEALPAVDFHCPLLSLPLAFDTDVNSIPSAVPYLGVEPARVARLSPQLAALPGLKIGIAWQGNPRVERLIWARGRSIPLAAFEPLARHAGVSLVLLQKGAGSEQLATVPFRDRVHDLGPDFDRGDDAFLDTAAAITLLDLVVSSDTAIVHLAGALGRPVWTLLNSTPDWRWLLARDDSPWYPTMRLFRAATARWDELMSEVLAALPLH